MLAAQTWKRTGRSSKTRSPSSSSRARRSGVADQRWVPVAMARRTVRSAESPYSCWLCGCETSRQRSVSRSTTSSLGSRATSAPLRAPTLVPSTRSGVMPRSKSARSMPTSTAPRSPPPPSTNAVVMPPSHERGSHELRVLGTHLEVDPVLDPEDQQRDQASDEGEEREADRPARPAREEERHDDVHHERPAVRDPQHAEGLAELLQVAALRGDVAQRERDEGAEREQDTHDEREHPVGLEQLHGLSLRSDL